MSSLHRIIISAYHQCIIITHHQKTVVIQTQDESTENFTRHFLANSADDPGICANPYQIRTDPGMIGWIRQKVASAFSNFKRLKNREDSSDFNDFLTKSITAARSNSSQCFSRSKKVPCDRRASKRANRQTNERANELSSEAKQTSWCLVWPNQTYTRSS